MNSAPIQEFQSVAKTSDFADTDRKLCKINGRPILLLKDGDAFRAVDNRCPHMGFPLDKGSLSDGILTCHWHHARFEAQSGCAFDLWADDIPSYEVEVDGENIAIATSPRHTPDSDYYASRLKQGMEQNISIIIYKSVAGLLTAESTPDRLFREIAEFGFANHDKWSDGMTTLTITANLWESLSEENKYTAACKAARLVAANCAGQPARRERTPLNQSDVGTEQINRWMRNWGASRHRDAAERSILTLLENGATAAQIQAPIYDTLFDRAYSDTGHNADFINKALELSERLGQEKLKSISPLTVRLITDARGEEEKGGWRNPIDLIPILRSAEAKLESMDLGLKKDISEPDSARLRETLLGEDPRAIVDQIIELLEQYSPISIARELCVVSFLRLARFPESNEIGDWFNPVHTAIHANAICQALNRGSNNEVCRGILHTALSIFQDRYLNIPAPGLPNPDQTLVDEYENDEKWGSKALGILDSKQPWRIFTNHIVAAFRAKIGSSQILDTLAKAVLREDLDFHKIQIIEAASVQLSLAQNDQERESILAGAARHTAAHAPTTREQQKMILIARRLQRGEGIGQE